jgi:hypothetical protein
MPWEPLSGNHSRRSFALGFGGLLTPNSPVPPTTVEQHRVFLLSGMAPSPARIGDGDIDESHASHRA